jgi:hypothetical protein
MAAVTSGSIIKQARVNARLSQTELARRAGVSQPVVSAYEADLREPALSTLTKLVEATGHHLALDLVADAGRPLGLPDTPVGRRLRQHRQAILDLATKRGVRNVRVFGSVARGDDTANSDVDLLVDISGRVGLVALSALAREIGELIGRPVDVVPASSLKRGVLDQVLAEAIEL